VAGEEVQEPLARRRALTRERVRRLRAKRAGETGDNAGGEETAEAPVTPDVTHVTRYGNAPSVTPPSPIPSPIPPPHPPLNPAPPSPTVLTLNPPTQTSSYGVDGNASPPAHAPLSDVPQSARTTSLEPETGQSISNAQAIAALMATFRVDADGNDLAPPTEPSPPPAAAHSSPNSHKPAPNGKPDLEAVVAVYNANRGTLPSVRKVPSSPNARSALLRMWEDADGDVALIGLAVRAASQDPHYQGGADHHPYGLVTIARHFAERWQGIASRKREQDAECDRWRPAE
jgi:hypothetical protein